MADLRLIPGVYANKTLEDVRARAIEHSLAVGKTIKVKSSRPTRLDLICSRGQVECSYRCIVTRPQSIGGVKITTFAGHTCLGLFQLSLFT